MPVFLEVIELLWILTGHLKTRKRKVYQCTGNTSKYLFSESMAHDESQECGFHSSCPQCSAVGFVCIMLRTKMQMTPIPSVWLLVCPSQTGLQILPSRGSILGITQRWLSGWLVCTILYISRLLHANSNSRNSLQREFHSSGKPILQGIWDHRHVLIVYLVLFIPMNICRYIRNAHFSEPCLGICSEIQAHKNWVNLNPNLSELQGT